MRAIRQITGTALLCLGCFILGSSACILVGIVIGCLVGTAIGGFSATAPNWVGNLVAIGFLGELAGLLIVGAGYLLED